MTNSILQGKTALITGASSGLGADFARELAARGCHLILVARREDLLLSLKEEIDRDSGVEIGVIPLDLTAGGALEELYDRILGQGKLVDVLVNNAGYGLFGSFLDIPWEREQNMLELDILVLTQLTKLFGRDMVGRGFGYILQIASNGAFQPTPTYATYAAAKAYVLSFGEALAYELRNTGVSCTVLAPGVTDTAFRDVAGQGTTLYQRLVMMQSRDVVRIGIEAMLQRRSSVVPGWANVIAAWGTRFLPRQWSAALAHRTMTMR